MEEQLKLKILDLLSDELNDEDSLEIFSLMENNQEAKEFYEHSKITFNLLNAEMNSAQWDASENRLESLIQDLDKKETSLLSSLLPSIFNIKSPGGILSVNNGLVAAFTFAFVILISPNLINQKISLNESGLYQEEVFISLTRSGEDSEVPLELKKIYIKNLIESGNSSGIFTYEDEIIYKISISEAFERANKRYYFGVLEGRDKESQNFSVTQGEEEIITIGF